MEAKKDLDLVLLDKIAQGQDDQEPLEVRSVQDQALLEVRNVQDQALSVINNDLVEVSLEGQTI